MTRERLRPVLLCWLVAMPMSVLCLGLSAVCLGYCRSSNKAHILSACYSESELLLQMRWSGRKWEYGTPLLVADADSRDGPVNYSSPAAARDWMEETNRQLRRWNHLTAVAEWNFATNISEDTQKKFVSATEEESKWRSQRQTEGRKFSVQTFDPDLRRQFQMFTVSADSQDPAKIRTLSQLHTTMMTTYDTAVVCPAPRRHNHNHTHTQQQQRQSNGSHCLPLELDLQDKMAKSRDPEELKAVWTGWREAARKSQRPLYRKYVQLLNEGARENGFRDYGDYWAQQQFPDDTDLEGMVAALWSELRPLYLELHAYTRKRLRHNYGAQVVGTDGTIPAHLLGNMWAQSWGNIYPLLVPFPAPSPGSDNLNDELKGRYDVRGLFELSEEFYASLGLFNMTATFWARSMLERPAGREVQCHPSAFDLYSPGDFRIKMCSSVTGSYLSTIHHEMGHVQYFMAYANQSTVFRDAPNQGFHEAIGDTVTLAVLSRTHLQKLGLASNNSDSNETQINDLMKMALSKIAFLPYALVVDQWRWQVFRGNTTSDTYNHDWWKLRLDLQGLRSPVPRSEEDFDAIAKMHVADNSPYYCYFISHVVQFQFYKTLCEESGHSGPLHLCDFGGSLKAGALFKKFLTLGASRPWQEALETFTGSRNISSQSMLEYFEPLRQWLQKENENSNEHPGWGNATINWQQ